MESQEFEPFKWRSMKIYDYHYLPSTQMISDPVQAAQHLSPHVQVACIATAIGNVS